MADTDAETGDETDHEGEPQMEWEARRTAPQSPYTTRDVAIGAVIALVGLFITFGVPLLLL
jgi:hypothetical protein